MTDLERIGQRLVTGFPGTALTPELVQVVKEYKIGNIILFREKHCQRGPAADPVR